MGTLHLKFYSRLRLRFPDVETNPGPRRPVSTSCRILCSNVWGLSGNLSDLAVASSQYDILAGLRFASRVRVTGSWVRSPCLLVPRQAASCPWDGGICTRWIWSISPTKISPTVPVRVTRGALIAHSTLVRLSAAEPRSTAWILFTSQYISETIWLTPYSMVWDWRVSSELLSLFLSSTIFLFSSFPL